MKNEDFMQGIRHGIPIGLGYFSVSMAFGMSVVLSGLPGWAAVLISMTNVTSAGQFAGSNLMLAGGSFVEIAVTTLIINIRYFLMSLSVSQKVDEKMTFVQRLLISFGITDEVFAVSMQKKGKLSSTYMFGLILLPILSWIGGTLAGVVLTSFLPEAVSNALAIALYGMFIAIIIPPARENKPVMFAVILAVVLELAFTYLPILKNLSGGWGIIIVTVAASAIAAWLFPVEQEES